MEQAELAQVLRDVHATNIKSHGEITTALNGHLANVERLEAALAAADDVGPEVQEALSLVTGSAKQLDDIIADAAPNPNPEQGGSNPSTNPEDSSEGEGSGNVNGGQPA